MFHIPIIPARAGSIGFPNKNSIFFDITANFLDRLKWFSKPIVSTNDEKVMEIAKSRNYQVHWRDEKLSGPDIAIKTVMQDVVDNNSLKSEDILWLIYIPLLYKNSADFEQVKEILDYGITTSICSFVPAKTNPYTCWFYDETDKQLQQFIPNDLYRRQDMPPAWMHHHYLCAFKVEVLNLLNNELIGEPTRPIFLEDETADALIEIDTPKDLEKWNKKNSQLQR